MSSALTKRPGQLDACEQTSRTVKQSFIRATAKTFGFSDLLKIKIAELERAFDKAIRIRQSDGTRMLVPIRALELHPDEKSRIIKDARTVLQKANARIASDQTSLFEMKESIDECQKAIYSIHPQHLAGIWKIKI
ncbi:hypothetical protein JXA56_01850 [Candidatus Micrarchaeota archaeon]|nr:hypothetical protein [Candidatus Micrarchaeota archaeon]